MFECSSISNERKTLWSEVEEVSPPNLIMAINAMTSEKKCEFILNGFNCSFIPEWQDLYTRLTDFVNVLYRHYANWNMVKGNT